MNEDFDNVTIHQYDDIFIKKLLNHAENGGSITSFRGVEGITEKTLVEWRDNHPNFKDALEIARCKEYSFWEQQIKIAFSQSDPGLSFEDESKTTLSIEKRINTAFNMIKLQQQLHQKITGRSLTEGNLTEEILDPTEFGSVDLDRDITKSDG